jgi:hypothetical protein
VCVLLFTTKGAAGPFLGLFFFCLAHHGLIVFAPCPTQNRLGAISFLTTGGAKTKIVKQKWTIENARRNSDVYFTFLEPSGTLLGPFWKGLSCLSDFNPIGFVPRGPNFAKWFSKSCLRWFSFDDEQRGRCVSDLLEHAVGLWEWWVLRQGFVFYGRFSFSLRVAFGLALRLCIRSTHIHM